MTEQNQPEKFQTSRRQFLGTAAATVAAGASSAPCSFRDESSLPKVDRAPTTASRSGPSASADVRSLLLQQLPEAAQIVALCDCNLPRAEGFKAKHKGELAHLPGLPQDSRPQGYRRGDRRHGRVSTRGALHPRLPGGQGRLRRKAVDALHPRGAGAGQRRAALRSRPSGRLAAAVDGNEPRRLRTRPQRRAWEKSSKSAP